MALHDIHYQHWSGRHRGIWRRRWVIADHGLRGCLENRWMRYVLAACWGLALLQMAVLFGIGQLLVEDSLVVRWAGTLQGMPQLIVGGLANWLVQHPEVSVRTAENLLFFRLSTLLLTFNLIAVMLAIPHLITRDLFSRAMLIYASKAVTRWDYLLGKLGTLWALMTLTWLAPTTLAWLMGNLLAPEWHFFWHSRTALGHALLFTAGAMVFLSIFGLGISAISPKEKAAVGLWLILWIVGNTLVPISQNTSPWLKYLSFRHDLQQVANAVFDPAGDLRRAQEEVPVFAQALRRGRHGPVVPWGEPRLRPALIGLGGMALAALLILNARTKTE